MKQPAGIWVLFITEMWERFSYYGMRALLVLYLIASNTADALNPGFGWSQESAYLLYAVYTWAVYLTPIFGGWLADRLLGTHKSLVIGGCLIASGHLLLAATELFAGAEGAAVSLTSAPGALVCFLAGLMLVVIGTGFFKPCAAVMVGQLYAPDDPRRDSGFTIYYLGVNLGAVLAPLVAGTLGETLGWHWGFGAAALGMVLGLLGYVRLRPRHLGEIGLVPEGRPVARRSANLGRIEWQRIGVILVLAFVGNIAFWTAFEQAGSSLNVFAAHHTDRTLWGWLSGPFPATWYQAVNPVAVILFAPGFALLWPWLAKRGRDPSTPMKFAIGLWLLGLSFFAMVFAAMEANAGEAHAGETPGSKLAGAHWLLITYVVYTWGELCLSPVGLSMVTRLAPAHLQSLMMGLWYFSFSVANLLAGLVARYSLRLESGEWTFVVEGLGGFYLLLALVPIGVGCAIALFSPWLKRWMHGVH